MGGLFGLVGLVAGAIAVGTWFESRYINWIAVAVAAAGVILAFTIGLPKTKVASGDNCYTDWDGRSNPTVCD